MLKHSLKLLLFLKDNSTPEGRSPLIVGDFGGLLEPVTSLMLLQLWETVVAPLLVGATPSACQVLMFVEDEDSPTDSEAKLWNCCLVSAFGELELVGESAASLSFLLSLLVSYDSSTGLGLLALKRPLLARLEVMTAGCTGIYWKLTNTAEGLQQSDN